MHCRSDTLPWLSWCCSITECLVLHCNSRGDFVFLQFNGNSWFYSSSQNEHGKKLSSRLRTRRNFLVAEIHTHVENNERRWLIPISCSCFVLIGCFRIILTNCVFTIVSARVNPGRQEMTFSTSMLNKIRHLNSNEKLVADFCRRENSMWTRNARRLPLFMRSSRINDKSHAIIGDVPNRCFEEQRYKGVKVKSEEARLSFERRLRFSTSRMKTHRFAWCYLLTDFSFSISLDVKRKEYRSTEAREIFMQWK